MRFVVGLGNPGDRYAQTWHNVGFMVVDALRARSSHGHERPASESWAWETLIEGRAVTLVKPSTYMNRSGLAVVELLPESASAADIVVVVDDVALELGRIRVRGRGGHGGHNGLRSIIQELGSDEFPRVRIGIGAGEADDLTEHVLSPIPEHDMLGVRRSVEVAARAVQVVLEEGVMAAMNRFNSRLPTGDREVEPKTENEAPDAEGV
jgi:PTH1 family peptidyl-tRNA hydrolase